MQYIRIILGLFSIISINTCLIAGSSDRQTLTSTHQERSDEKDKLALKAVADNIYDMINNNKITAERSANSHTEGDQNNFLLSLFSVALENEGRQPSLEVVSKMQQMLSRFMANANEKVQRQPNPISSNVIGKRIDAGKTNMNEMKKAVEIKNTQPITPGKSAMSSMLKSSLDKSVLVPSLKIDSMKNEPKIASSDFEALDKIEDGRSVESPILKLMPHIFFTDNIGKEYRLVGMGKRGDGVCSGKCLSTDGDEILVFGKPNTNEFLVLADHSGEQVYTSGVALCAGAGHEALHAPANIGLLAPHTKREKFIHPKSSVLSLKWKDDVKVDKRESAGDREFLKDMTNLFKGKGLGNEEEAKTAVAGQANLGKQQRKGAHIRPLRRRRFNKRRKLLRNQLMQSNVNSRNSNIRAPALDDTLNFEEDSFSDDKKAVADLENNYKRIQSEAQDEVVRLADVLDQHSRIKRSFDVKSPLLAHENEIKSNGVEGSSKESKDILKTETNGVHDELKVGSIMPANGEDDGLKLISIDPNLSVLPKSELKPSVDEISMIQPSSSPDDEVSIVMAATTPDSFSFDDDLMDHRIVAGLKPIDSGFGPGWHPFHVTPQTDIDDSEEDDGHIEEVAESHHDEADSALAGEQFAEAMLFHIHNTFKMKEVLGYALNIFPSSIQFDAAAEVDRKPSYETPLEILLKTMAINIEKIVEKDAIQNNCIKPDENLRRFLLIIVGLPEKTTIPPVYDSNIASVVMSKRLIHRKKKLLHLLEAFNKLPTEEQEKSEGVKSLIQAELNDVNKQLPKNKRKVRQILKKPLLSAVEPEGNLRPYGNSETQMGSSDLQQLIDDSHPFSKVNLDRWNPFIANVQRKNLPTEQ